MSSDPPFSPSSSPSFSRPTYSFLLLRLLSSSSFYLTCFLQESECYANDEFHQVVDRDDYQYFASFWVEGRNYLNPVNTSRQALDNPQTQAARRALRAIVAAAQRDVVPTPLPQDVQLQAAGYMSTTAASHNCSNAGVVFHVNATTGALERVDDLVAKVSVSGDRVVFSVFLLL